MCRGVVHPGFPDRFLGRMIRDAKRKVFLISGNFYVHHDNVVKNGWTIIRGNRDLFLQPESPELDSDAYFNGDLYSLVHSADSCLYQGIIERKVPCFIRTFCAAPGK